MHFTETKERISNTNVLQGIDVAGSFDFYTAIITLESLKTEDIESFKAVMGFDTQHSGGAAVLTPDQYGIAKKVLPLLMHEYTHFVDSTSTLWGLKHLQLMNRAYLSDFERGGTEEQFVSAKVFFDHTRSLRLPKYYTTVNKGVPNVRPWQSQVTVGKLFGSDGKLSDRGVVFSRFANRHGRALVRSPVSPVSLLEASAMAQELFTSAELVARTEPNFRVVEMQLFTQQMLDYLYNTKITEYSVCGHLVANAQNCSDIFLAFRTTAVISRLIFNFSETIFQKLAADCPVGELLGVADDHPFAVSLRNGLLHRNLGAAYYLICLALPKDSYLNVESLSAGVHQALERIGVKLEFVLWSASDAAEVIANELTHSPIRSIADLAEAGIGNFKKIDVLRPVLDFSKLNLPPVLLGDSNIVQVFHSETNSLSAFSLTDSFEELYSGQSWIERFSEGCV